MADISIITPGCEDEDRRGKRGPRGHDGHDGIAGPTGPTGAIGATGPTGATGPVSTGGSFLKFAGAASALTAPSTVFNFLTDAFQLVTFDPGYPVPTGLPGASRSLRNMAVNMLSGFTSGTVTVQLLLNGIVQPQFVVTFSGPVVGGTVLVATTALLPLAVGDKVSIRTTTSGFPSPVAELDLTALVGLE